MNKLSLLTLVLVVALPGCGNKKQSAQSVKKDNVAKYADTTGIVMKKKMMDEEEEGDEGEEGENPDEEEEYEYDFEDVDGDDSSVPSEEDQEYIDLDDLDFADEYTDEDEENQSMSFRWVDSQMDDDFKPLYFTFNHYGIRDDQKTAVNYDIAQVKQLLADAGTTAEPTIVIEGHACQEGDRTYNVALSEKRAKVVADLFVAAGVDKKSIKVVGRGQECPAVINGKVVNGSREDRAPNRRVEIRVIYT